MEQPRADPRAGARPELGAPTAHRRRTARGAAAGDRARPATRAPTARPQRRDRRVGHRDDDLVGAGARERALDRLDRPGPARASTTCAVESGAARSAGRRARSTRRRASRPRTMRLRVRPRAPPATTRAGGRRRDRCGPGRLPRSTTLACELTTRSTIRSHSRSLQARHAAAPVSTTSSSQPWRAQTRRSPSTKPSEIRPPSCGHSSVDDDEPAAPEPGDRDPRGRRRAPRTIVRRPATRSPATTVARAPARRRPDRSRARRRAARRPDPCDDATGPV